MFTSVITILQKGLKDQMREKAKAGELKAVNGSAAAKVAEKKKRRWDQPAAAEEPAKKKASSWDQAEVGTPSHVCLALLFLSCTV